MINKKSCEPIEEKAEEDDGTLLRLGANCLEYDQKVNENGEQEP